MTDQVFNLEVDRYKKYKNIIVSVTIILFILAYLLDLDIFYGVVIIILGTTANIILKSKYRDILRDLYKDN
ncbi:MAG: hypothetical protein U9R16_00780 [Campylobacterota bacterium]|nr:hypothetical protein [Campylobacterota bacterium]